MPQNYEILASGTPRKQSASSRCGQLVMDNANIFKAFIGTNFLSASFALSMSGLYLGLGGLVLIASVTVHCCYLIVQCKRYVIKDIIKKFDLHPTSSHLHGRLVKSIEKSLSYGDIARLSIGRWGMWLTNFSLVLTQFGFCINYFIFIGNTVQKMFPFVNGTHESGAPTESPDPLVSQASNWSDVLSTAIHSTGPRYEYLVLIPFPLFVGFAYLRRIRQLGSSSIIANVAVLIAYAVVMYYILRDFSVHPDIVKVKWDTFPVFFGQIAGSYEGIGTIIPIESSMEGNRHLYPLLLHINVLFFTMLMATIGILGYMFYGNGVQQMIIWSLPLNDPLTLAVNITLVVAILFTYPLQVFPIIEILEQIIFGPGQCLGPPLVAEESINNDNEDGFSSSHKEESSNLIDPAEDEEAIFMRETFKQCIVTVTIPDSVATWKRNVLRTLIVIFQLVVALAMKDSIAYFGAFIGAIGSTILGFILPCTIHLVLRGKKLHPVIWVKNITMIALGVAGGISGVYVSIMNIVNNINM